jgi:hypothetical protein
MNPNNYTTLVYNTIPKSWECLIKNCVVDETNGFLFYHSISSERLCDDYNQNLQTIDCMAMKKNYWMTSFLFKEFIYIFKRFVLGDNFQTNHRVLILDGHCSHVILKALQYTTYCIIHYHHIAISSIACITTCKCCMNNTLVDFFSWFSLQTNVAMTISW